MIPLFCFFPSLAAKPRRKRRPRPSLETVEKVAKPLFRKGFAALCASIVRFSGQFDARSGSVFCQVNCPVAGREAPLEGAHVAAENRFNSFHICGRETLRGFFSAAYLSPRTAANIAVSFSLKSGIPFFDYFLSPAKCSRVSLITTGLSSSSAMRFGMDMRPLSVSEISHTSVRSATAPATTTRQKMI